MIYKDWDKARALFEAFTQEEKSFRDIEKESGVPVSSLRDRAKKERWIRGKSAHLKPQLASITENLAQESAHVRTEIINDVEKVLKAKGYIENVSLLAIKQLSKLMPESTDMKDVKAGVDSLKGLMVTTGVVPYYPPKENKTEVNINPQVERTLSDFYSET